MDPAGSSIYTSVTSSSVTDITDIARSFALDYVRFKETQRRAMEKNYIVMKKRKRKTEQKINTLKIGMTSLTNDVEKTRTRGMTGDASVGIAVPENFPQIVNVLEQQIGSYDMKLAETDLRFQVLETTDYNGRLVWKIRDFDRRRNDAKRDNFNQIVNVLEQQMGLYDMKLAETDLRFQRMRQISEAPIILYTAKTKKQEIKVIKELTKPLTKRIVKLQKFVGRITDENSSLKKSVDHQDRTTKQLKDEANKEISKLKATIETLANTIDGTILRSAGEARGSSFVILWHIAICEKFLLLEEMESPAKGRFQPLKRPSVTPPEHLEKEVDRGIIKDLSSVNISMTYSLADDAGRVRINELPSAKSNRKPSDSCIKEQRQLAVHLPCSFGSLCECSRTKVFYGGLQNSGPDDEQCTGHAKWSSGQANRGGYSTTENHDSTSESCTSLTSGLIGTYEFKYHDQADQQNNATPLATICSDGSYPMHTDTAETVNFQPHGMNYLALSFDNVLLPEDRSLLMSLNLQRETDRRKSFAKWPPSLALNLPSQLSRDGIFYLGKSDRIQCFSCGGTLSNWPSEDCDYGMDRLHLSECKFVDDMNSGNISMTDNERRNAESAENREMAEKWRATEVKRLCKTCKMNEANAVLCPCNHLCVCEGCSARTRICPICTADVQRIIQVTSALSTIL